MTPLRQRHCRIANSLCAAFQSRMNLFRKIYVKDTEANCLHVEPKFKNLANK